ncbi:MAG: LPS-assembly protein LptD [bacterium]|nr:LPS-assembly protein LptD [bacterium]
MRRARWTLAIAGCLLGLLGVAAAAIEPAPIEVRVLSTPGVLPATRVALRAGGDAEIEDRTVGARPAGREQRGVASLGDTFAGEITLFLRGATVARPSAIEVGDPLVSAVRMFPEAGGTLVVVFVRRPVAYSVSRPSAAGEITLSLKARARPATAKTKRKPPAASAAQDTGEIAVDAAELQYEQNTDVLVARGDVTLTRGATTLRADEVRYDRRSNVVEAKGNVVLTDEEGTVEGDAARIDMEDETGWVDAAEGEFVSNGYMLRADRLTKKGGPCYEVRNGIFTTCRCGGLEKPSWSIAGRGTEVTLNGTGVVRDATFRVQDVPVAWVPWMTFPANTERQSGFLVPRIAYSNRRGFQYEQPFYWAINKSSDATIALDVETAARIGIVSEYRYALDKDTRGNFTGAYYNESLGGTQKDEDVLRPIGSDISLKTPENRFAFAGRHRQPGPFDSLFYFDLFAVSDDLFLREINNFARTVHGDLAIRSTRFTRSRTGLIKTWTGGLVQGEATYYQDLIDPQQLAPQRLPQVRAEHAEPVFWNRVVARLSGQAVDFQREDGFDGLRGTASPELFVPFNLGRYLGGSVRGSLRGTGYHLTSDEQVALIVPTTPFYRLCRDLPPKDRNPGLNCVRGRRDQNFTYSNFRAAPFLPDLDQNQFQGSGEVHARVGTEFSRVFDADGLFGQAKFRHTIEPEAQYLYIPPLGRVRNEIRLPPCQLSPNGRRLKAGQVAGGNCNATAFTNDYLFDEIDAINFRNFASYGITSRLLGRPTAPPRAPGAKPAPPPATKELLRASILHGYDFSRDIVGDSHASNVDMGLRLTPSDWLGASYNATWDFEDGDVVGQNVGLVFREPWWRPSAGNRFQTASAVAVSYSFVKESANAVGAGVPIQAGFFNVGVEDVVGSVYLRLGDYAGFTFIARYDLDGGPVVRENGTVEVVGPGFLERDYLFRLISKCNCWAIEAGVAEKTNPDETIFRLQITLLGLGSYGSGRTANYVGMAPLQNLGYQRPSGLRGGGY